MIKVVTREYSTFKESLLHFTDDKEVFEVINEVIRDGYGNTYWRTNAFDILHRSRWTQIERDEVITSFVKDNEQHVRSIIHSIVKSAVSTCEGYKHCFKLGPTYIAQAYLEAVKGSFAVISPFVSTLRKPLSQAQLETSVVDNIVTLKISNFNLNEDPHLEYSLGTEVGNYLFYKHLNR